ncbi:hypothetical protein [Wenxinia marina]|uniref:hypothetical protein n=1 Tax=Wenxinia marina TaxID=390641 RepID=UPI0009D99411|nr:hypothetical protein [Wenxinia marina]GGL50434.1 hypothetical protein GCM10011392_00810 [Wenxinia marina]
MTFANITRLPFGINVRTLLERELPASGFALTREDRAGIERLLRQHDTKHAPNPPLLNGLLRHKLRISAPAPRPTPLELVVGGSHVTYKITGEGARSGVLSMSPIPLPGQVLVASLLGATLLGMRKLQKAPLLRSDGEISAVVILDVDPPRADDAA